MPCLAYSLRHRPHCYLLSTCYCLRSIGLLMKEQIIFWPETKYKYHHIININCLVTSLLTCNLPSMVNCQIHLPKAPSFFTMPLLLSLLMVSHYPQNQVQTPHFGFQGPPSCFSTPSLPNLTSFIPSCSPSNLFHKLTSTLFRFSSLL